MKKRTRAQKFADLAEGIKAMKENRRPKRQNTSIPTHPVFVVPDILEKEVLKDCLKWLKRNNILCNRNSVGTGMMSDSGIYSYGIKNAGDIIGLLPTGLHFEIECKRGRGGQLSAGQQKRMKDVQVNNGVYLVVHGWQELEYYMGELL